MISLMTRTIKAHFDGRVFVPDEPVNLPSGHSVEINVQSSPAVPERGTLADIADWVETLPVDPNSPRDAAAQHDHYLYGTRKRENP
jgi:hypothetical protein